VWNLSSLSAANLLCNLHGSLSSMNYSVIPTLSTSVVWSWSMRCWHLLTRRRLNQIWGYTSTIGIFLIYARHSKPTWAAHSWWTILRIWSLSSYYTIYNCRGRIVRNTLVIEANLSRVIDRGSWKIWSWSWHHSTTHGRLSSLLAERCPASNLLLSSRWLVLIIVDLLRWVCSLCTSNSSWW
jgi:hypothetical protein